MHIAIREKRKIRIEDSIITPAIIKAVASTIDHEVRSLPNDQQYLLNYTIDTTDDSSYESQSPDIFNTSSIIDLKTLERVQIRFQTVSNDKNIEVQFRHSDKDDHVDNYIVVSGNDSVWVNGVLAQLTEIVDASEQQPIFKKYISFSIFLLCVAFNVLYFRFFYALIQTNKYGWIEGLLTIGVPILSIYLFDKLAKNLESIWPDVELQTGPNYMQIPAMKRKRMVLLMTLVIVPIITAFIYDVLKSWLHLF